MVKLDIGRDEDRLKLLEGYYKKKGGVGIGDWDWLLVVVVLSEEGTWRTCVMGRVRGQFTVQGVT